jgi:hypothetical protein
MISIIESRTIKQGRAISQNLRADKTINYYLQVEALLRQRGAVDDVLQVFDDQSPLQSSRK